LLKALLAELDADKNPVGWLYNNTLLNMGDICKRTGLSARMAKTLREGKKAGKCQRAACRYALIAYELNL